MDINEKLSEHLTFIYKKIPDQQLLNDFIAYITQVKKNKSQQTEKWNESDVVLITYGDSILSQNQKPLATLHHFLKKNLSEVISTVHVLPFFPYSSDDGFSVIDYKKVNPELGSWNDIDTLSTEFQLMVDLVINHISSKSDWFRKYLQGDEDYNDYFIEVSPETDLTEVVRPRSLPLLTKFNTHNGEKYLWTTFSGDQIDLNFSNPKVLFELLKILVFYLEKKVKIIRLDAIAFLWKKIGTSCIHLSETHQIVKMIRDVMEYIDPSSIVLTETNVPNKENLSYFGNNDEAHMVYQFSLPPLLLYTLFAGNSRYLNKWAMSIPELPEDNTFFNFTASHDGIGVRPLEGLLPDDEKENLFQQMLQNGGKISTKKNSDGSESAYELNITYFDALKETKYGTDNLQEQRFICSQTIMAAFKGIPAFYIHSFTATRNYTEGVEKTGKARTINRMKWIHDELENQLNHNTHVSRVFKALCDMLLIRKHQPAFHPSARQKVISLQENIFAVKRISKDNNTQILSVSNVSKDKTTLDISNILSQDDYIDLLSGDEMAKPLSIPLNPYQTRWLKKK